MLQKFDPRNRDLLVNINGTLVHRDQAGISPFDSAVQGGDAVWEGLRLYDGRIFKLHEHLARLRGSAQALAFAHIPSDDEILAELRKTLAANRMVDGVHIRLTLTRGVKYTSGMDPRVNQSLAFSADGTPELRPGRSTLIVLAEHKPPVYDRGGISLATSAIRRFPPDCKDPKIHHCNLIQSILAKIQANQAGADDALMLDTRGFVAETNATHVFLVSRDVNAIAAAERQRAAWGAAAPNQCVEWAILTPFCHACPEGITRATVLELCRRHGVPHAEADVSLTEVYRADEVLCTGTMGEIVPVTSVDGRRIGDGAPGKIARQIGAWYSALTRESGVMVVDAG